MRTEQFTTWMQAERVRREKDTPSDDTIKDYYIPHLLEVEAVEGDLDQLCIAEGNLNRLWESYYYTEDKAKADWGNLAINGSQNPVKMRIHPALLLTHLTTYRSCIKYYKEFCDAEPPVPIEDE